MKVKDLLVGQPDHIGRAVPQTWTVAAAIDHLRVLKTSALVVTAAEAPVGVFSAREVLRCLLAHPGRPLSEIPLAEAMTRQAIVAEASDEVSHLLAAMLQADLTHLPVVAAGRLVGVLPLASLVRHQIDRLTAELHYLQNYIDDLHGAEDD
jgi:IMP dehydrogenase